LRKLNKSEKRLLLILGVAIFLIVNYWGVSYLMDAQATADQDLTDLRAKAAADDRWLREKTSWMTRKRWVDAQQPRVVNKESPQADLLQALVKSAKDSQLKIDEQSFAESDSTTDYRSVAVKLKVSGPLKNAIQWLVQVQQPQEFHAVTDFSLKSQEHPPDVSLELNVARWYAPATL
jgi:type II secretory pathway component PulM